MHPYAFDARPNRLGRILVFGGGQQGVEVAEGLVAFSGGLRQTGPGGPRFALLGGESCVSAGVTGPSKVRASTAELRMASSLGFDIDGMLPA